MTAIVIEWTPCPSCQRNWLTASEAAIAVETYGKCPGCILLALDAPARAREQAAGCRATRCPSCIMVLDPNCATCAGTRSAVEALDGSGFIDIRQSKA